MTRATRRAPAGGAARGEGHGSSGRILAALSHPTRVGILTHLRAHKTASPSEIASALDLPLGTVSYHVRRLDEIGLVDFVEYGQRRGAIQHFYALSATATNSELVRELTASAHARQSEPSRADARALLDATAIGELRAELRHLFARLRELEAETVRRAGVKGHARTFAVEVACVMDAADEHTP